MERAETALRRPFALAGALQGVNQSVARHESAWPRGSTKHHTTSRTTGDHCPV